MSSPLSRSSGPLRYDEAGHWVPISDADAREFVRYRQASAKMGGDPLGEPALTVIDGYCFVFNRDGNYDRWRGAGHKPWGDAA